MESLMAHFDFDDLPFNVRPDLTPYIVHFTKNSKKENDRSAFDNLVRILKKGKIRGSDSQKGFIKGPNRAACFMDVPFSAMKYVINPNKTNPDKPHYEPYGIIIHKSFAYERGCRPVLYLSDEEKKRLNIPKDELWRVVRFELQNDGWISWIHEREWRCCGNFHLPSNPVVLVKTTKKARKLSDEIRSKPSRFKSIPRSIIPLSVICQGFPET